MVAFALVHGRVDLNNLTEEALVDPAVLQLTALMEVEQTQKDAPGLPPGDVRISSASGDFRFLQILDSETALDEVKNKFIQCCYFAEIANPEVLWDKLSQKLDYGLVDALLP